MCSAVDEKGRRAVAKVGRRVVDGELGRKDEKMGVPVVLAAVGEGSQRDADDAVGPSVTLMTPLACSTLVLVLL